MEEKDYLISNLIRSNALLKHEAKEKPDEDGGRIAGILKLGRGGVKRMCVIRLQRLRRSPYNTGVHPVDKFVYRHRSAGSHDTKT